MFHFHQKADALILSPALPVATPIWNSHHTEINLNDGLSEYLPIFI